MTIRTVDELLAIFADGQGAGAITPQDMRDLVESTIGATGWAAYQDATWTTGAPQEVAANTATKVEIDGTINQKQELPFGVSDFWDAANDEIIVPRAGSGLMISFETTARRASGSGAWEYRTWIDIGLPGPVALYPRDISFKDNGDKLITWTTGAYALDTWVANGGGIYVQSDIAFELYQSRVIVHQTHRGRGTYPPA